jgi:hypothetical protein
MNDEVKLDMCDGLQQEHPHQHTLHQLARLETGWEQLLTKLPRQLLLLLPQLPLLQLLLLPKLLLLLTQLLLQWLLLQQLLLQL